LCPVKRFFFDKVPATPERFAYPTLYSYPYERRFLHSLACSMSELPFVLTPSSAHALETTSATLPSMPSSNLNLLTISTSVGS